MPDPCIITMLRSPARLEPHTCNAAADEIERLRVERDEARHGESVAIATLQGVIEERTNLRSERDEARLRTNSILTEIDCRIEHGAESNGHLEAIRSLFKESNDE